MTNFKNLQKKIPDNVIIVVDEAYIEFVRNDKIYDSLKKPLHDPRIVTLRTFSKAYGLAGFRVGYGIMDSKIVEIINKIRQPFNVNTLAQAAALAALDDEEFLNKSIKTIHKGLDFLSKELTKLKIKYLPTQANFLMIDTKTDAEQVICQMLKHGIIVRSMKPYGFNNFIRVNAGTKKENIAFITALEEILN